MYDILVRQATILSMETTPEGSLRKPFIADIAVEGQRIAAIEPNINCEARKVIEGQDYLVMPGLVNMHTHLPMSYLRSYGDDLPLQKWLETRVYPAEDRWQAEDILWATQLALWEMIESGTTCCNDMYFFVDEIAQAVDQSGLRAVLSRGIVGDWQDGNERLAENIALYQNWHGADHGRIQVAFAPHAIYTCSEMLLRKISEIAQKYQTMLHIHLAETKQEFDDCRKKHGTTPTAYLAELGCFDNPTIAAHAVWLTEEDENILAQYGVKIAHCPRSNLKLGNGMAKSYELLQKNVGLGFGTDGACSNNDLNLFLEMRQGSLLAKGRLYNPLAIPAEQALTMATRDAFSYLGFPQAGVLQKGNLADFILLDCKQPHFLPPYDLISHLVYSAQGSDVQSVIINGKIIMEKREMKTLDTERIRFECYNRFPRILA